MGDLTWYVWLLYPLRSLRFDFADVSESGSSAKKRNNDCDFQCHSQSIPQQDQSAPQSASLQTEHGTERTHSTGQKRSPPATTSASAAEAFTPKRRRGARKKVRTEEELAIRRKNHLQRNRDAAHKCRQKKKLTEAEKREHIAKERHKNLLVWKQIAAVQDELESLRGVTLDIENHCQSSDHKTVAKTSIELIMKTVAKLQDQIDMCNQRRAQISQGLVMQRSFGGYAQQDSIQDGPGSIQDRQSPVMSSRTSTGFSEQMLSPRSTRGSSYATCYLLVYGPSGAGKKTRIVATLKELYGPGVEKIKIDSRVFQTTSPPFNKSNHLQAQSGDFPHLLVY